MYRIAHSGRAGRMQSVPAVYGQGAGLLSSYPFPGG